MDLEKIKDLIKSDTVGNRILVYEELDSTNDLLFKMGEELTEDGTVVISDYQTMGRGRLNRSWFSPKGVNIYCSALFRPKIGVSESAVFTFIASLALMDSYESIGIKPKIKWPNDLVFDGRKLAGVLTEMKPGKNFLVDFIVVGMGANLNMRIEDIENKEDISAIATSACEILGRDVDRVLFVKDLLTYLDKYYNIFLEEGVHSIVAYWVNRWGNINRSVKINIDGRTIEGVVKKVDRFGYLYLETDRGDLVKVISGDIVF